MSDLKLFKLAANQVPELSGSSMALEKSLQTLIEKHLDTFLGITLLASEFSTGARHGGRMDTLGIDENGAPEIIEYKKATNAKAFRGELVPQDPNDEPASALLGRLPGQPVAIPAKAKHIKRATRQKS